MSQHALPSFRVGLVGYGVAGAFFHGPLIAATPGLVLDSVVTRSKERAAQALRDHPGVTVVNSIETLLERKPALTVIASPNRTHVPFAMTALRAGTAVVVDKPLAATALEAQQLIDEAAALGRTLTVFQNRRWDSDFLTLRSVLEKGTLGTIHRFESSFERWRPELKHGWREQPDAPEAGGLLYDLGSHLIDQALQLFGPVRHVYAEMDCRRSGAEVDDEDFVALEHESGVRSHLWMSALAAHGADRFRVLGSKGAFRVEGLDGQEAFLKAGGRPGAPGWAQEERQAQLYLEATPRAHPLERGQYDTFYPTVLKALQGEAPVPVDPNDSVKLLKIIQAANGTG